MHARMGVCLVNIYSGLLLDEPWDTMSLHPHIRQATIFNSLEQEICLPLCNKVGQSFS